jgi:putative membrane protein
MSHRKYFLILSALFFVEFLILAISPYNRADWALENVMTMVVALVLGSTYKKFPFSRISYSLIFVFMCLHEIGSHYTYARVPYDSFLINYFNFSLNDLMGWERNNYDRVVHFLYGLFLTYPFREVYCRFTNSKGFWGYFFPLLFSITASMSFELLEWAAVELFGGELGMLFLGTQGDIWDAHKDMALAALGALIAILIVAGFNYLFNKNFFKDWNASLRIKRKKPMGEDEIVRLLEKQDKK